ncbi:hypothetical protein HpSP79_03750 [Helicobacter pylori]
MKKLLLTLFVLSAASAHASHVREAISMTCTYQDLTAPNSRPKRSACSWTEWESMHVYDKQRGGYVADNGEGYRLPGGKTVTFSYEAFMKSEGSGPEIGKWTHSPKQMNGRAYRSTERQIQGKRWTCHRSATEELCVQAAF